MPINAVKPAFLCCLAGLLFLSGCAAPGTGPEQQDSLNIDGAPIPANGIVGVRGVAVKEMNGDRLELVAFAEQRYKMQQVMAVLWCRAREEARRRNYDGWYAVSFRQAFSGSGNQRQAAIGTVQMFRGAPPPGKETLRQQKNWCLDAPAAARNS